MSSRVPTVHGGFLIREGTADNEARLLRIDTPDWFGWLDTAHCFQFNDGEGSFTARKQQRSLHWYWYAHSRRDGRLRSAYLGKSIALTMERLLAMAQTLSDNTASSTLSRKGCGTRLGHPTNRSTLINGVPLLVTKLAIPHAQRLIWTRACQAMEGALDRPLTTVSAPAGFGKTTLVAQWCTRPDVHPAWVSLDEGDN